MLQVVDAGGDPSVLAADYKYWKIEGGARGQVGSGVASKSTLLRALVGPVLCHRAVREQ